MIAAAIHFGRSPGQVVDRLALLTGTPARQAGNDLTEWQLVVHDRCQVETLAVEQPLKRFGGAQGAGKAVKDKSSAAMQTAQALADHLPHSRIRHEVALPHKSESFLDRGTLVALGAASGTAEHVPGRKMARIQTMVQQLRLRSLAHAGSTQQHEPCGRMGSLRNAGAMGRRALEPRSTVGLVLDSHALTVGS